MARLAAKIGIGLLVITGVGMGVDTGVAAAKSPGESLAALPQSLPAHAEVAALVDGDSFDVRSDNQITRVRLGDVAAPVAAAPVAAAPVGPAPAVGQPAGRPASCLAAEASAQLATMIPAGTQLTLTYGKDRLGHTTAQAVTADGRLVNAELVESGLAHEVRDRAHVPIPAAIDTAARDALANRRGLHDPAIACTVPGQVKALADLVATVPAGPPAGADLPALVTAANGATDARMAAEDLDSAFAQNRQDMAWLALDPNERAQLEAQVQTAGARAAADETVLRDATNTVVNQNATQAAAQKEAARIAKSLAEIRKAEADRAAEAASRLAAARKAQADAAQSRADARRTEQARTARADQDKQRQQDSHDGEKDSKKDDSGDGSPSKHDKETGKNDDKDGGKKK